MKSDINIGFKVWIASLFLWLPVIWYPSCSGGIPINPDESVETRIEVYVWWWIAFGLLMCFGFVCKAWLGSYGDYERIKMLLDESREKNKILEEEV